MKLIFNTREEKDNFDNKINKTTTCPSAVGMKDFGGHCNPVVDCRECWMYAVRSIDAEVRQYEDHV